MSKTSNPQKRRKSIHNRPIFAPNFSSGGTGVDLVSGTIPVTAINGIRYGIVNGVVTQFAVNQPPIEDDGIRGCPAFTQLAKYSENLTNAAWAKGNILTPITSGTYQGSAVWFLPESTAANEYHTLSQISAYSGAADNSVLGFNIKAKSTNRKIQVTVLTKAGTYLSSRINLSTGAIESQGSGVFLSVLPGIDGFWNIFAAASILTGVTTPYIYIDFHNGSSTQYTGDGVSGVYFSQPTLINFGVNGVPFIHPYVPNNTGSSISVVSEAATATTGTSFDLDDIKLARLKTALRGPNAQGHLDITVKSNISGNILPSGIDTHINIFSVANDILFGSLRFRKDPAGTLRWVLSDGVQAPNIVVSTMTVGQIFRISLDWGAHPTGQKMRITVDGVQSPLANFSGSFGAQDLRFFYGNTAHAGWIKKDSLKYYERPQW